MRIQHNIMAMNAYRNYTTNTSALSKNLEKLSSGYKINRAGDDAAGLAISEKMRAQITGLDVAQKNAKDGISLVQTAEGALTEVHDMLNRMYELAEQSANGTYDSEVDRANLQKEVDALREEVDRIANTANFNKIKLFTGEGGGKATPVTDIKGTFGGQAIAAGHTVQATKDQYSTGILTFNKGGAVDVTVEYTDANGAKKTETIQFTAVTDDTNSATAFINAAKGNAALSGLFDIAGDKNGITFTAKTAGAGKGAVTSVSIADKTNVEVAAGQTKTAGADETKSFDLSAQAQAGDKVTIDGKEYTYNVNADGTDGKTFKDLNTLKAAAAKNGVTLNTGTNTAVTATKGGAAGGNGAAGAAAGDLWLQIGEDGNELNRLQVKIGKVDTASLGIDGIDIGSQEGAWAALENIENAINTVSGIRGDLGAIQNRLDHTINNLSVMEENIQDAESTIRDTDVADEMMAYTKNNILIQSAQAMLAQANQVPQGVLQLLQ